MSPAWTQRYLAERVGFEPTVRITVLLISSQARSTTPAPLLRWAVNSNLFCRTLVTLVRTLDFTRHFPVPRPAGALCACKSAFLPICRVKPVRPLRHLSSCGGANITLYRAKYVLLPSVNATHYFGFFHRLANSSGAAILVPTTLSPLSGLPFKETGLAIENFSCT